MATGNKEPISVTHPNVAVQAHGWDPTTVTAGSKKKREWQCEHSHIWAAIIKSRTSGRGCPVCAGKQINIGFNDLATTHPELAAEADGWDPTAVTAGSHKQRKWQCERGHTWSAEVASRTSMKSGCPYCANSAVLAGFNDLATTHPELAAEADGWDPTAVTAGSNKKREWQCQQGHVWVSTVGHRSGGQGCAVCAGKQINIGFNDLATTHPGLAAEAHGWDPTTVTAGSGKKHEWQCEHGHIWPAVVSGRSGGEGCPVCAGKQINIGFNDLATTHPELAAEAHDWDPTTVTAGSGKKREWQCQQGHVWSAIIRSRTIGRGCPFCAGKQVLIGFNDLATTHPELAAEAHDWDPTTVTAGSVKKREWQCQQGHVWVSTVGHRSQGQGCPFCAGKQVLIGFNDLATTHPELAAEAHGWDPTTVTAGSNKKREWQCQLGHIWTAIVKGRSGGQGCPTCAPSGFDPNSPGWIYLLQHDGKGLLQIGISNFPETRLASHSRGGWEALDLNGPLDGTTAREIEQAFLKYLDANSVPRAHTFTEQFDASGYTEAWRTEDLPVTSLSEVRDLIREWGSS
jgi:hypothetical protein